jgi:hypothetical protein
MEQTQHSTWYQVETDIALRKLTCPCGKDFLRHVTELPICPACEKEAELPVEVTHEQLGWLLEEASHCLPYGGDADVDAYLAAREELESRLQKVDWWYGDRRQIQYVWNELRESHHSWESVREYFKDAYAMAYHRDDY